MEKKQQKWIVLRLSVKVRISIENDDKSVRILIGYRKSGLEIISTYDD